MIPLRTRGSDPAIDEILASIKVQRACSFFRTEATRITEEQIAICTVPAPPFGESERARYFERRFHQAGLLQVKIDDEGNCVGLRPGKSLHPLLVISAHLDTVFPPDTDFTVHRRNGRLFAPGIADDGCGLVALPALIEVLDYSEIKTEGSILFVATVGEEGEGNLRGARYLFEKSEWAGAIDAFISFDGPDIERITNGALGSRRYRVRFRGPGGHSWGDFGVANPISALGRAIARLAAYPAPAIPRTTFNVGRISGGTGTNVIPVEAEMDVDLRSESEDELRRLDAYFRRALREAADDENAVRRRMAAALELDIKLIGDRPLGETPPTSDIVRLAEEATRAVGATPRLERSSTDSNIPISLGIPAVTLGAGGYSGSTHTLDEWYDPRDRHVGLTRALLLMLALVGIES
jgi:acetylornithine deacetylase/succinyl-diaminopimelate desuccinylase-like protein